MYLLKNPSPILMTCTYSATSRASTTKFAYLLQCVAKQQLNYATIIYYARRERKRKTNNDFTIAITIIIIILRVHVPHRIILLLVRVLCGGLGASSRLAVPIAYSAHNDIIIMCTGCT